MYLLGIFGKSYTFAVPIEKMPDSITVVRQTLTLFVLVRIQVGQQEIKWKARSYERVFSFSSFLHISSI